MPKETVPQVTFTDLKKQRLAISKHAMIRYKGELYSLQQFLNDFNGGTWRYNVADLGLFDPVSCTNYDVKPTVQTPA